MKKSIFICFSTSEGSVSDYFVGLSNMLSQNYNIIVISDNKYKPKKLSKNIELHFWPSKRPTHLIDFYFYLRLLFKKKPILTISIFGSVNVNIICSYLNGVRYRIAWKRSLSSQFKQKKYLVKRKYFVYRLSNLIITNSKSTALDAEKFHKINPRKLKVIPNSVLDNYNKFSNIIIDQNKILYVGRLHKTKGVDILINAFSIISEKHKQLKLVIVGSGPKKNCLVELCKKLNIRDQIIFAGKVSKNKVLEEMKSSYATVVPSYTEAFGFTVIEAMSMKTCVIGANNTGIKETIQNEKTGLLFKTGDSQDLAEKLISVTEDNTKRDKLAEEGYKHFKKYYSTESAVKRDADYFINLIENN